jgi:hypothetical protein
VDRNQPQHEPQRFLPRLTAMAAAALAVAAGILLAPSAQAQIAFRKQQAYHTASGDVYRRGGEPDSSQTPQSE